MEGQAEGRQLFPKVRFHSATNCLLPGRGSGCLSVTGQTLPVRPLAPRALALVLTAGTFRKRNGTSPLRHVGVLDCPACVRGKKHSDPFYTGIRNLAESEDAKIIELSLEALCRIEGDKDIVGLRLQKALATEKDSQKQARIQSASKALAETSFGN